MEALTVDRAARTAMAEALRHLAAGQISNDEFVERLESAGRDVAVTEIHRNGAWYLYDDTREHRLTGRQRLGGEARLALPGRPLAAGVHLDGPGGAARFVLRTSRAVFIRR
ncbi:MAG TPA: hypothetical protein VHC97_05175 [Thermoanaerobaculia bacterium]|jgi:hypothetical protein|nr:hypothetical protein [Thermoanaerobaculia bacterium]